MKRLFSLSPRLQAIADLVPAGARMADVGTDHGRLPVWLVQQGQIPSAVATDLRPGPLSRGKALADRWELSDRISFRLCDALAAVSSEEAEVITITGMGGETIAEILQAAPWVKEKGCTCILQAMSGMEGLRRYLSENSFSIEREILVLEEETLYVILLAKGGEMPPLSEGEIWVGRQQPTMKMPLRGRYLEQELGRLHWAAEGLSHSQREEDKEKYVRFLQAAQEVEEMKKEWDQWQLC